MKHTCPNCNFSFESKSKIADKIIFNPETRKFVGITPDDIGYWVGQFPAVNIEQELSKMEAWLYANPKNRKSKYVRFITNWLSKAQDKAPRVMPTHEGQYANGKIPTPSWKSGVDA